MKDDNKNIIWSIHPSVCWTILYHYCLMCKCRPKVTFITTIIWLSIIESLLCFIVRVRMAPYLTQYMSMFPLNTFLNGQNT